MSRAIGSESVEKRSFSAIRGSQCRSPLFRVVGILLLTVVNKIKKGKTIFLSHNIKAISFYVVLHFI
jgi:hypothetical protein